MKFILLLGLVSLFGDITYEGARSITGPFLALLGANATTVGVVAGLGELIGYCLRLASGFLTDKTGRYWLITFTGYTLNLVAIPLLALAGCWQIAALLIISERLGKAIRTPARDAMLSHATSRVGRGWGFGLHEAMDQIGALAGPLLIAAVMTRHGNYRAGFGILAVPAFLVLVILATARILYPRPRDFEPVSKKIESKGLPIAFWMYLVATALIAAGYADFALIAYHFKRAAIFSDNIVPVLYAVAMGSDAVAALIFGRLFDRLGVNTLIISSLLSSLFAPLVFLGGWRLAFAGMVVWGIGMAAQESVLRAAISEMVPSNRRGSAYGIFNTGYGLFWFLGSSLMGILYDRSVLALVIFSIAVQLAAVPVLLVTKKQINMVNT
ncbi:MAG: MFS transporter [Bacillota bacterium]|nr:MFS transporter [Bacillota bacterium]